MTDADLERHTGVKPQDIIKYSDLKNYNDIQELLPTNKSFKIILIEDEKNSGHWVSIMRYGKTIEYYNSYGAKYDTDWKFINRMKRLILGESTNEMTRLMDKAVKDGFKVIWNTKRHQKIGNRIQTCGRWNIMRIEMMKMGFTNEQFNKKVKELKAHLSEEMNGGNKVSNDFVVSRYVF